MKNNYKLGTRLSLAFGSLVLIMLALGGITAWNMHRSAATARQAAGEGLPAITIVNDVQHQVMLARYEILGYAQTSMPDFLNRGRENIAAARQHLEKAREHASRHPGLTDFATAVAETGHKLQEYDALLHRIMEKTEATDSSRNRLDDSSRTLLSAINGFRTRQYHELDEELKNAAAPEKITERSYKLKLVSDIDQVISELRLATWRAQAEQNPHALSAAQKHFAVIISRCDELQPITRQEADIRQIAAMRQAAAEYRKAIDGLALEWEEREKLVADCAVLSRAMIDQTRKLAAEGLDNMRTGTLTTGHQLGTSTLILYAGLAAAFIIGSALSIGLTRSITRPVKAIADTLNQGAEQTAAAAGQVSSASQTLAAGASEQAAALEETSSSLEELASMTRRNTDNAQQVNSLAREARAAAETGAADMSAMAHAMQEIQKSSGDVARIIKTIDEIAFQTNILA
ncbi:methyl-accepting chemotaxis protein, partial [Opitutaceae bacterium TAV1]